VDYLSEAEWKKVLSKHLTIRDTGLSAQLRAVKAAGDAFTAKSMDIEGSEKYVEALEDLVDKANELLKKYPKELGAHLKGMVKDAGTMIQVQRKWANDRKAQLKRVQQEVKSLLVDCNARLKAFIEAVAGFAAAAKAAKLELGSPLSPATAPAYKKIAAVHAPMCKVCAELLAKASMLAPNDAELRKDKFEFYKRSLGSVELFTVNAHGTGLLNRLVADLKAEYSGPTANYFKRVAGHCE